MVRKTLTRKQEIFVDTFVETGVGSVAAREAYDIAPEETHLAAVIASENLTKPDIQEAVERKVKTRAEMAEEAHESLLTLVRLDYFVFPKSMDDTEITSHVEAQGLTVLNIRPSEKGKLAFYSIPDGAARSKGVELHHKIAGTFAPDKSISVNVDVEATPRLQEAADKLNELLKGGSLGGARTEASAVDTQAQDKE